MSFKTQPAFVAHNGWDDETRKHPAMKWMENYTKNFIDKADWSKASDYHTDDFTLQKSSGEVVSGIKEATGPNGIPSVYAPFAGWYHAPSFAVTIETANGWQMMGQANVYANLHGQAASGEKKVKSEDGKEWDIVTPGAFLFEYVKDGSGVKLKSTKIYADSAPGMMTMVKRGLIKPSDLGM